MFNSELEVLKSLVNLKELTAGKVNSQRTIYKAICPVLANVMVMKWSSCKSSDIPENLTVLSM